MSCDNYTSGNAAQVALVLGTVNVTPCPQTIQQTAQAIVNAITASLPGNFGTFNVGSNQPTPANQDKLWYQVNQDCTPVGWRIWNGASWINALPHGMTPGTVDHYWLAAFVVEPIDQAENKIRISYRDTGDAYVVGVMHTNPFWWLCDGSAPPMGGTTPNLLGRVIVGAGASLDAGITARVQNDSGGAQTHVLAVAEITTGLATQLVDSVVGAVRPLIGPAGVADAHNNMQPYRCVYPVIRTSRTI